ncbi:MAG: hypothetical protein K2M31_04020 [Muribaculaceae bacterium]|nr:hypothetical protein [Muribaculaceae bacterium]
MRNFFKKIKYSYIKKSCLKSDFLNVLSPGALLLLAAIAAPVAANADEFTLPADYSRYKVFDKVVFYDGYISDRIVDGDLEDGTLRFSNYHYARPLNVEEVLDLGCDFRLEVIVGALCDNYDRMGRVMLAFPEAGSVNYDPQAVERIEIARFITPFMNKNKLPDEVPYIYDLDDLRQLLADPELLSGRDVWMEVEIFGIPYDANKKVKGCEQRNDVFAATVSFAGHESSAAETSQKATKIPNAGNPAVLTPITISKCEIHGNVNFNNYNEVATDTLGVTTKTFNFDVPADLTDAQINFILTNHGAGENGEEYVRRQHLVYVDGDIAMVYTPGGVSCEPYRKYNTQGNFIYGSSPEDDWEEWNNWCPGQAVPTRKIQLGAMKAGRHKLMIRVPDAEFYGNDGDFRPSAYLQGVTSGKISDLSVTDLIEDSKNSISLKAEGRDIIILAAKPILELRVYSYDGTLLLGNYNPGSRFTLPQLPSGQYIVVASTEDGDSAFVKVII